MQINKVFPSTYLKAADLEQELEVVIDNCKNEDLGQGDEVKEMPVLHFRNGESPLVLNKTNFNTLLTAFPAQDTDEWSGRAIILFSTPVQFKDKMVDGIRIRIPQQSAQPTPAPNKTVNLDNTDPDVPF